MRPTCLNNINPKQIVQAPFYNLKVTKSGQSLQWVSDKRNRNSFFARSQRQTLRTRKYSSPGNIRIFSCLTEVGPGAYNINITDISNKRNCRSKVKWRAPHQESLLPNAFTCVGSLKVFDPLKITNKQIRQLFNNYHVSIDLTKGLKFLAPDCKDLLNKKLPKSPRSFKRQSFNKSRNVFSSISSKSPRHFNTKQKKSKKSKKRTKNIVNKLLKIRPHTSRVIVKNKRREIKKLCYKGNALRNFLQKKMGISREQQKQKRQKAQKKKKQRMREVRQKLINKQKISKISVQTTACDSENTTNLKSSTYRRLLFPSQEI